MVRPAGQSTQVSWGIGAQLPSNWPQGKQGRLSRLDAILEAEQNHLLYQHRHFNPQSTFHTTFYIQSQLDMEVVRTKMQFLMSALTEKKKTTQTNEGFSYRAACQEQSQRTLPEAQSVRWPPDLTWTALLHGHLPRNSGLFDRGLVLTRKARGSC